jgi:hypothetical protein
MRKQFPCGHRGRGQYCHRCEQEKRNALAREVEAERRRAERAAVIDAVPVDASGVPLNVVRRAARIIKALDGGVPYAQLKGKRLLNSGGDILSVPVGRRYRLVARAPAGRMEYLALLSHEDYNNRVAERAWQ